MAADYPAAVFAAMTRGALMSDTTTQGAFVDKLQDEARAIEQTLGVNPQGAYATVKAWLDQATRQSIQPFATAAARDVALPSPTEGMQTYQADTKATTYYTGTAWKTIRQPFTAYTPTISTGITVGNGTWAGNGYTINGETVTLGGQFTWGTTTSFSGSSSVTISLPVAAHVSGYGFGIAVFIDASTSFVYQADIQYLGSGTTAGISRFADGGGASFTATTPFTWTTSDQVRFSITYPQA
jgi:hypothetical protein